MSNRTRAVAWIAGVLVLTLPAASPAAVDPPYPTTGPEARSLYEGLVTDWAHGPVQYLLTSEEQNLWQHLATDIQREAFKRWFWDRRDPDPRDAERPLTDRFYESVAEANRRFREAGIFRGWRSDRGRTWILLGRPDGVRPAMALRFDSLDWTYYTAGRKRAFDTVYGELHVLFVRPDPADGYRVWDTFGGAGIWPRDVLDAFAYTREGFIQDPTLELPAEIGPIVT